MSKVTIDVPEEYKQVIDRICKQKGLTKSELFLEAMKAFLSAIGTLPEQAEQISDAHSVAKAVQIQDMLAEICKSHRCDCYKEIAEWRHSLKVSVG